jgi:hypothetical protein
MRHVLSFGFATNAHVAQLVEHVLGKDEVTGSIPVMGSTRRQAPAQIQRNP